MNNQALINEGQRKVRTSAAVIGLALSMSATGMLLHQKESQAVAAESTKTERTVTIPPAALEPTANSASGEIVTPQIKVSLAEKQSPIIVPAKPVVEPEPPAIKHEIAQGETLWELSQNYQIEPEEIAQSNKIDTNTTLEVGKSLKIPVTPASVASPKATSPTPSTEETVVIPVTAPEVAASPRFQRPETEAPVIIPVSKSEEASKSATATRTEAPQLEISASEVAVSPTLKLPEAETPVIIPVSPSEETSKSARATRTEVPQLEISAPEVAASPTLKLPEAEAPVIIPVSPSEEASESPRFEPHNQTLPKPEVAASPTSQFPEANTQEDPVVIVPVSVPETKAQSAFESRLSTETLVESQPVVVRPATFAPQSATYQVRPGDTLNSIARRYGVSHTELIRANQISDPNLIKVDQELRIPGQASIGNVTPATTTLFSRSSSVEVKTPNIRVSAQIESPTERSVEKLKADIQQLQQAYREPALPIETRPSEESFVEEAAVNPVAIPVTTAFSPEEKQNSEWQADRNLRAVNVENYSSPAPRVSTPPASVPTDTENLVAVAPISVESYNPMLQSPVGERVSPDLPPLNAPDQYLPDSPERFEGYIWPAKGVLTSGYGWRWGRMHKGIDIAGPVGTPILASAPGEVVTAGWNSGGYGNLVKVKHDDGTITLYAHNNRILVRRGQKVEQGQQIAEMGSTGYSTGPHLHFEVHPQGSQAVNPMALLPKR